MSLKVIEAISLIIGDLIVEDGPETWEEIIKELSNWLTSNDVGQNHACLEVFCNIMSRTNSSKGDKLHIFVPYIITHLMALFTRDEVYCSWMRGDTRDDDAV
jgi:hypothetical protein